MQLKKITTSFSADTQRYIQEHSEGVSAGFLMALDLPRSIFMKIATRQFARFSSREMIDEKLHRHLEKVEEAFEKTSSIEANIKFVEFDGPHEKYLEVTIAFYDRGHKNILLMLGVVMDAYSGHVVYVA